MSLGIGIWNGTGGSGSIFYKDDLYTYINNSLLHFLPILRDQYEFSRQLENMISLLAQVDFKGIDFVKHTQNSEVLSFDYDDISLNFIGFALLRDLF